MTHPDQVTLALHAGGDLGPIARWRINRHIAHCERCRDEVAAFAGITEVALRTSVFSGIRAAIALASVAALLVTGLMLEHPAARPNFARFESRLFESGIVLESTKDGIEVGQGRQALELRHAGARRVTYTVGAQGSIGARYLDPKTGYVTINNVYVEE